MSGRLPPGPRERIDRSRTVNFTFDGKQMSGFEGDTVGSALHAAGRQVISRSFKYHRPRGLLCCAGQCPNCMVEVDGWPGVRACTEPVREGMEVKHMNAKPSLDFDAMRATDIFGKRLTPPGFYYKTFIRPRRLWPLYEKVLRNAAGLGKLPKRQQEREWRTEYRRRFVDVLVIGGGGAGMAAALRAAEMGADVMLVDDGPELGGALLAGAEADEAQELGARVRAAGIEILSPAAALGFFDGLVPVWSGDTLHQVRAQSYVAATGSIEQPLMFKDNDIPGVMLCSGAERLASLYGVRPGKTAVVATTTDRGVESALSLREAGIEIAAIADSRPQGTIGDELGRRIGRAGIAHLPATAVVRAFGRKRVKGVVVAPLDHTGRALPDSMRGIDCDLVAVSGGTVPATSLLLQAGGKARWDEPSGSYLPDSLPANIHVAGEVAGHDPRSAALSGAVAGAEAALAVGHGADGDRERLQAERGSLLRGSGESDSPGPSRTPEGKRGGKCFACLCEDVTADDISYAIEEGYDSLELLKRYTTVTMGPCQGRMCQLATIRRMSEETGASVADVGLTTARPPWSTVPMGALAGRPFEPAKRSAVHGRHRQLDGNVMWAGDWRRPYDYGDPEGEAMAVHDGAGLIDVSTLGKLMVRGPQAGEFLNLLYPNRFDNLKPGRIRYGVLGDDAGRITDDGTICRLDENSFYVTTTSSGADAVEAWFAWWLAEWNHLDVHLTDVSQGLSAFNLAGPKSREILSGLTDLDCTNEGYAYLDGKRAHVAGVPCLLLRIGFVGELGYELHCPGALAEHLWDALMEAGEPYGIKPFGLEPQRILRLQKMHILVGQDTDAESNPLEAAMPWIVKLDKEEQFIGRWALEAVKERGDENRLVGFTISNGDVPTEGAAVVDDGMPVGRVTSSRFSPKLERSIGMAWVPVALAEDGTTIELADEGRRLSAQVQTAPFYDPDQERLRS